MISVHFQGKPFNITEIQVYAPTKNAKEAEAERFYEDLQVLLELTPKKDFLFIMGDWNAKVGEPQLLPSWFPSRSLSTYSLPSGQSNFPENKPDD